MNYFPQRMTLLALLLGLALMSGLSTASAQTPTPTVTRTPTPTRVPPLRSPTATPTPTPTPPPMTLLRGAVTERPYTVMYDNHRDAYPQTGLNAAPLVFEALAEFGITRYMAVFVPGISPDLPTIGPLRSARSYFVEYAKGMRGVFVHAGGSPDALALIPLSVELLDMDALRGDASRSFWRATDRFAPHNLFTSSARIAAFIASKDMEMPDLSEIGFLIKDEAPLAQRPPSQYVRYHFIYREAFVGWDYDRSTNSYLYFRQQRPHVDAVSGEQVNFKNVIVLEVPERPILGDAKGRIEQDVIGEGAARIFMDGQMIEAVWRKGAGFAQLQLFDASDREIALNPGPVWIAAIPSLDNLGVEGGLVATPVPTPQPTPTRQVIRSFVHLVY
ncbi:MAG: DUF3048 domain-containing protein [Candidatus Viridilinea halotolerans]|uniref:DUF3048 domain-containing protein n=1 Tax=Candidatus Viridilinea halotolerans TaxID=2491704 RepID=A0A426U2L2_9CHLR|nr:MAG: DUF3048 domain-containing protein [Candidatus Viridilinea halotolerans]